MTGDQCACPLLLNPVICSASFMARSGFRFDLACSPGKLGGLDI
jgi:hypothetical protein